jgi:hypothetical protein
MVEELAEMMSYEAVEASTCDNPEKTRANERTVKARNIFFILFLQ